MDDGVNIKEQLMNDPETVLNAISVAAEYVAKIDLDKVPDVQVRLTGLEPDPYITKMYGKMNWQKSIQELEAKLLDFLTRCIMVSLMYSEVDLASSVRTASSI